MANGKQRRLYTAILALCLLVIVAIGWQMWLSLSNEPIATYGERVAQPEVERRVAAATAQANVRSGTRPSRVARREPCAPAAAWASSA